MTKEIKVEIEEDDITFEIGKEYTWKDFEYYNNENELVKDICKFEVTDKRNEDDITEYLVEYIEGIHKDLFAWIPSEDMPETE